MRPGKPVALPVFDERLLALYERLARAEYDLAQLQAFCRLLTAICRIGLRMTWSCRRRRPQPGPGRDHMRLVRWVELRR
jgi:hypothetical protein